MHLRITSISGALIGLLVSGACSGSQEPTEPQVVKQTQEAHDSEMVQIKIRMPDGRVIIRMEPRKASKIDPNHPIMKPESSDPTQVYTKSASSGKVIAAGTAVTGGSNSGAATGKTGGSGGGGGGARGAHSGGGGGGSGTNGADDSTGSGTNNSADIGTSRASVQPDDDYRVRMYAWDNDGPSFEHVAEAYVVDTRSAYSPEGLAQLIASQVERDQPEKVALRFWKEFIPAQRDPFDHANPRDLINSGGYTQGLKEYWDAFALALAATGVEPDYLIFDMEDGIGFWNIPTSDRLGFFEELLDPARPLSASLPQSMRTVTVSQFMNYQNQQGTIALNDYTGFSERFRADLLYNVFGDAFKQAYGRIIPMSNYKDSNPSFDIYLYSSRPFQRSTVAGISAPMVYVEFRQNANRYARLQKDQRWNRLIDALNQVRSMAANELVTPWISAPGYGRYGPDTWARAADLESEYRIWEILMDHMLAMGIDTFLLWNPGTQFNPQARASDAFVDRWLAEHPLCAGPQLRDLPETQLDVDEIVTNGVVTRYSDFLDALYNR